MSSVHWACRERRFAILSDILEHALLHQRHSKFYHISSVTVSTISVAHVIPVSRKRTETPETKLGVIGVSTSVCVFRVWVEDSCHSLRSHQVLVLVSFRAVNQAFFDCFIFFFSLSLREQPFCRCQFTSGGNAHAPTGALWWLEEGGNQGPEPDGPDCRGPWKGCAVVRDWLPGRDKLTVWAGSRLDRWA